MAAALESANLAPALLACCPNCGGPLSPEPAEQSCARCSLPVDRRWRVFGGGRMERLTARTGWLLPRLALGFLGTLGVAFVLVSIVALVRKEWNVAILAVWYFLFLTAFCGPLLTALICRPASFIALGAAELVLCERNRVLERIGLAEIRDAGYDWGSKSIRLDLAGRAVRWPALPVFGVSVWLDVFSFTRLVRERAAAARIASTSTVA